MPRLRVRGLLRGVFEEAVRYPRRFWRARTRPRSVVHFGVRLEVPPDLPEMLRRDLWAGRYERSEARALVAVLEPDDVVLEGGGGSGFLSTLSARRVGSSRVVTCEADPISVARMRRTHAANGVAPRILEGALGARPGRRFFETDASFVSSGTAAQGIEVTALDAREVVLSVRPSVLVLDVEGSEAEILPELDLSGVRKVILETHPARIGEAVAAALLDLLRARGFRRVRSLSTRRKHLFLRPDRA